MRRPPPLRAALAAVLAGVLAGSCIDLEPVAHPLSARDGGDTDGEQLRPPPIRRDAEPDDGGDAEPTPADGDAPTTDAAACTPALETCDGADEDCDGRLDEDLCCGAGATRLLAERHAGVRLLGDPRLGFAVAYAVPRGDAARVMLRDLAPAGRPLDDPLDVTQDAPALAGAREAEFDAVRVEARGRGGAVDVVAWRRQLTDPAGEVLGSRVLMRGFAGDVASELVVIDRPDLRRATLAYLPEGIQGPREAWLFVVRVADDETGPAVAVPFSASLQSGQPALDLPSAENLPGLAFAVPGTGGEMAALAADGRAGSLGLAWQSGFNTRFAVITAVGQHGVSPGPQVGLAPPDTCARPAVRAYAEGFVASCYGLPEEAEPPGAWWFQAFDPTATPNAPPQAVSPPGDRPPLLAVDGRGAPVLAVPARGVGSAYGVLQPLELGAELARSRPIHLAIPGVADDDHVVFHALRPVDEGSAFLAIYEVLRPQDGDAPATQGLFAERLDCR